MRTDTCANCGRQIILVKTGRLEYTWQTDKDKRDSWKCEATGKQHAPQSMQATHR